MAERENSGEAEQEIERHRREAHDDDAGGEFGVAADRAHPEGHEQQNHANGDVEGAVAAAPQWSLPSSPSSPRGLHQQHEPHHHVDHRLGGGGKVDRRQPRGDADHQAAEQRSKQTAEAADDDRDKARHDEICADGGREAEEARRQHAGEAGHIDADAEVEAAQHPDVDAKRRDRVEVARAGADSHAKARVFEHREQAADRRRNYDHHEHAIAGEKKVLARQRAHEPGGDLKRNALRAPDHPRHILENVGEPEGQEQTVERVLAIERADQEPLDDEAKHGGQRRREDQRAPESDIRDQGVGEIGAERQKSAMGEIDDAAQVEDERQAKRHQRVERTDDQAIEDVEQDDLSHASGFAVGGK